MVLFGEQQLPRLRRQDGKPTTKLVEGLEEIALFEYLRLPFCSGSLQGVFRTHEQRSCRRDIERQRDARFDIRTECSKEEHADNVDRSDEEFEGLSAIRTWSSESLRDA